MITRRQLLVAAGAAPVAALAGADAAEAKPVIIADSTVRTWGPVALIGDSLSGGYMGGLRKELVKQGVGPFRCDIQGSRSINRNFKKYPSGISAVRSARAARFDPPSWVVALGGNDMWFVGARTGAAQKMIDEILTEIGADRHVFFFTYWQRKTNSYPKFNAALFDATSRWPNLHVADWGALAKKHPEWHGPDGAHYNGKGATQRNLYTVKTMIEAVKAAQTPPPPTTTAPPPSSTDAPPQGIARTMSTGFAEAPTCSRTGGAHVV